MIPIEWVGPPRWWQRGRTGRILYVVVHATEAHGGETAAEAGHQYDTVRPEQVSTHVFVDDNTCVQEVHWNDTAFAAYPTGNAHGIQVEICHVGPWNLSDAGQAATLDNAAQVVAQICVIHDIPAVKLSVPEVRSLATKGICAHYDVTLAYPADGGTHSDPDYSGGKATGFPWAIFIQRVARYVAQIKGSMPTPRSRGTHMQRYYFAPSYTDRPAGLVDPKGQPKVFATDGVGAYSVRSVSFRLNDVESAASGSPVIMLDRTPKTGNMPDEWGFAEAFAQVTGGCTFTGETGLAPWRAMAGGPHVHPLGASGVVSVSGTTGEAMPSGQAGPVTT